jgi:hypothetical protein
MAMDYNILFYYNQRGVISPFGNIFFLTKEIMMVLFYLFQTNILNMDGCKNPCPSHLGQVKDRLYPSFLFSYVYV